MTLAKLGAAALLAGSLSAAALVVFTAPERADAAPEPTRLAADLKPASAFTDIKSRDLRAVALFEEASKVLQSPRCMNCHPAGDRPTQTDRMIPHQPLVVRGEAGMGAPSGLACTTCHHEANFDAARVPGNPKWQLAPIEMAWQGRSLGQICAQIKDPKLNGGKTMAELVHHMAEDELVGWGWNPGAGRTPAPGTQKQFGELIKAWVDAGAACPKG
ncbi:Isoquinoline 1-oxidoreductase subunit [Bradyrhizobium ontarionense]|uniref:Isoquinoline 1-oxidoreductase subunit n=1 Tax=Bradyrhizobium ontarionense TaxID=2898149 RepID=A0ABY3RIL4_9BRAD|nr:Isoquinoline 1-oxidoreductase subunit [Bradyrhizobium sp. A19]UFZ06464.1 Isoquinoline 1-oxidoreductase subunit [Bradyrhizobium sp. A19]